MITQKSRILRPHTADTRFDVIFIAQFGFTIFILLAVLSMRSPSRARQLALDHLPTDRPTPTATPDWWHALEFAQMALPALPALPAVALDTNQGQGGGFVPNQPIPIETLACPLENVRIASIVTGAKPAWWHIAGTANIADFWYWKGELSSRRPPPRRGSGQAPLDYPALWSDPSQQRHPHRVLDHDCAGGSVSTPPHGHRPHGELSGALCGARNDLSVRERWFVCGVWFLVSCV